MKNSSLMNKDLALSEEQFSEAVTNDFIGTDFIDRLEWAMLMIQQNFNQMRLAEYLPLVTYLLSVTQLQISRVRYKIVIPLLSPAP
jgi:hypothetical protein